MTDAEYRMGHGSIYLVFEYMDHDLTGLLDSHWSELSERQIKSVFHQIVSGMQYCHKNDILHRDIKGSNVLVDNKGVAKLADFGLARYRPPDLDLRGGHLTNRVITLWYRPPELLLGATQYSKSTDMWSIGYVRFKDMNFISSNRFFSCIFGEMITGKPLFQGANEIETIDQIFQTCGTPTHEDWPEAFSLSFYSLLEPKEQLPSKLRSMQGQFVTPDALDLLCGLLVLNPDKRLTAEEVLWHPYFHQFTTIPEPFDYAPCHELQSKELRKKRQQRTDGSNSDTTPAKIRKTSAGTIIGGSSHHSPTNHEQNQHLRNGSRDHSPEIHSRREYLPSNLSKRGKINK